MNLPLVWNLDLGETIYLRRLEKSIPANLARTWKKLKIDKYLLKLLKI